MGPVGWVMQKVPKNWGWGGGTSLCDKTAMKSIGGEGVELI